MRPVSPSRTSLMPRILMGGALLVFGGMGICGTLAALGVIDVSFLKKRQPAPTSHEGLIPVPLSAQRVPMYTQVTRDFLFDPKTNRPLIIWLRPDEIKPTMLTKVDQIIGRVTNHDKPVGYLFTEEDFFPKGTRPGLEAGVPPGKRAITVEIDKIHGIREMNPREHFDLMSSVPMDFSKNTGGGRGILNIPGGLNTFLMKRAAVWPVVQDGVVVSPVVTRKVPVTTSGLTSGMVTRMRTIQEITIAVDLKEVAPLDEAMAIGADVWAYARSGRPDDPAAKTNTPALKIPKRTMVETIIGGKRQLVVFPPDGGPPEVTEPNPPLAPPAAGTDTKQTAAPLPGQPSAGTPGAGQAAQPKLAVR